MFLLTEHESIEEVKAAADAETKIEVYDRVIKDCVEALQALKEELKSDEVKLLLYCFVFSDPGYYMYMINVAKLCDEHILFLASLYKLFCS